MAREKMDEMRTALRDEEKRLRGEIAETRKRVKELEAEAARVREALAALSGKPSRSGSSSSGKKSSKSLQTSKSAQTTKSAASGGDAPARTTPAPAGGGPAGENPSTSQITEIAADALIRHGSLSRERLQDIVGERLRELGLSREHLAERLEGALSDPRFTTGPAGCRLVERTVRRPASETEPTPA